MKQIKDGPEIILNLWYVVDDLGVIYTLRVRAYIMDGTDETKLEYLRTMANFDYLIARIFSIPKRFQIRGQAIFHNAALDMMSSPVELFEEAIQTLQNELPAQTPYDIPDQPLVCITPLFGDDEGHIHLMIDEGKYI